MRLKPSPWRLLLLLAISSGFVAIGLFLLSRSESIEAWLCVGFFGLGAIVALVSLIPGSSYLELRPDGIEICSLFRKWFVRWGDVQYFFPMVVSHREMVGWNYSESYTAQSFGRKLSSGMAGVEAALPDTYGLTAEALSCLLNEWRLKHVVAP